VTVTYITKGTTVRVTRLLLQPIGTYSLSGSQMKLAARSQTFEGIVRHVRGNHPTAPTSTALWVEPTSEEWVSDWEGAAFCEKCGVWEIGSINPESVVQADDARTAD